MKILKRLLAFMLVLTMLATSLAMFPLSAAGDGAAGGGSSGGGSSGDDDGLVLEEKKTQKVVTVVYDDSGSMTTVMDGSTRFYYAKYASQMLISLLNEGDILQIVPMNNLGNSYSAELKGSRVDQINQILSKDIFDDDGSYTPLGSIDYAIQLLEAEGMNEMAHMQPENREYWLFVLTDGLFTGINGNADAKKNTTANEINNRIAKYDTLKTIYLAFSNSAIDLRGTSFEGDVRTAYMAANGDGLISAMQSIAAQLSGRYGHNDFQVNGNTVTVNLNSVNFPIKNLSLVALNCNETIASVKHNGTELQSGSVTQEYVTRPSDTKMKVNNSYSALVNGSPSFSGGTLTITFTGDVSGATFSIFVEPALILEPTYKIMQNGNYTTVDSSYITGGKVTAGQVLRIGYICKGPNGNPIDVAAAFNSPVSASVTYNGSTTPIASGTTETDITLVQGGNSITITVNIEGVNYKMYTSVNFNILQNQDSYKVVGHHATSEFAEKGSATVKYDVYVEGAKKTPAQLTAGGFTWYIEITKPDKTVVRVDTPEINGEIAYDLKAQMGEYGNFKVYFRVVSTLGWRMDETAYSFNFEANKIEVKDVTTDKPSKGASNTEAKFTVHYGGAQLDKDAVEKCGITVKLTSYDGEETEITPTVNGSGMIIVPIPLDTTVYGAYKVDISVDFMKTGSVKSSSHLFEIYPTTATITAEHEHDAFPSGVTKTSGKYVIKLDGQQLTKADLEKYKWTAFTYVPGGASTYGNEVTVDTDGTIHVKYDVAGAAYGAYKTEIVFNISDTKKETYSQAVNYYPLSVSVNLIENGKLSLSQHQITLNDKTIDFELFSDGGLPLVFDNGVTKYKVLVGNKDVTKYAVINGNRLSFAPHVDALGGVPDIGNYTVTVQISCDSREGLESSASSTYEITKTLYEIVSFSNNKKVERFDLKDINAGLRFVVYRDKLPLPLDELKAAYESGEIKITDEKGTFTWEFWLPLGREIIITEIDGTPLIEFKLERDFAFLGLDKVMAMFFFTGDKPISISYQDVSLVDNITIQRGAVWVYLLIWFIIFFITHLILFGIGFINGKCKNLPSGVFVSVSTSGPLGKKQEFSYDKKVNMDFKSKWGWHLGRLLLYGCFKEKKLWYHQPPVSYGNYQVALGYFNGDDAELLCKGEELYKVVQHSAKPQANSMYKDFEHKVSEWNGKSGRPEALELTVAELNGIFKLATPVAPLELKSTQSYDGLYGERKKDGKLGSVMKFIGR